MSLLEEAKLAKEAFKKEVTARYIDEIEKDLRLTGEAVHYVFLYALLEIVNHFEKEGFTIHIGQERKPNSGVDIKVFIE